MSTFRERTESLLEDAAENLKFAGRANDAGRIEPANQFIATAQVLATMAVAMATLDSADSIDQGRGT